MPTRWNVDHQHALIDPLNYITVAPGEPHEFTDEQIAAGIAGQWSEEDPRAGLDAEKAFKKRRDAKPSAPEQETQTPAESGETKE